jgi:RNA polymerase sigma-70 factor (ECF subfamily)
VNRISAGGVLAMARRLRRVDEDARGTLPHAVTPDDARADEFEARLHESTTLAFRVAYGVLRHRQDAEDVAQEALVRAFERRGALRERERFRAWLVRITWRAALDRRRADARRGRRDLAAVPDDDRADGERLAIRREREERVWRAVDALPEELRLAVVLAAIEGHQLRDVAALTGTSEGTVKSRLHRARRQLAESLKGLAE